MTVVPDPHSSTATCNPQPATCNPHTTLPNDYFPQVSAQLEQFEISPDLDLGWCPPLYQFHTRPILRFIFPKFQLDWSNLKFDLTLTLMT